MALLTEADYQAVKAQVQRDYGWAGCTKADLDAAIRAADAWCDANAVSYNSALPQPFRTNATAAQKSALLDFVARRRAGLYKAQGE